MILCLSLIGRSNSQATPTPAPLGLTIHVLQRGETLEGLAQAYGLSLADLLRLNSLSDAQSVQVGQRLLVPAQIIADSPTQPYIVQPGETLDSLANRFGLAIAELIQINGITDPNQVYSGQVIQLPSSVQLPDEVTNAGTPILHTVQRGETLFQIALAYGSTVSDLVNANSIADPTRIFVGQQLIIPVQTRGSAAQALPAPLTSLQVVPLAFVEGETGVLRFSTSQPTQISGTFLERELRIISDDGLQHLAIIGVPLLTPAGIYRVSLRLASNSTTIPFAFNLRVLSGSYATSNLNLSQEQMALLAPAVEEFELGLLTRVTTPFNIRRLYTAPFSLPAAAAMNAPFGTRRSYNGGEVNRIHNGADFASAPGAPVYAAAAGRVVLADLLNIRGNTIVLDHGWGVYSVYAHLSSMSVQLGDSVRVGQIIGAAGATGRVTGPHLHWEVWVNGVSVNPLQWTHQTIP
ncbi:MAG: LysM peptidoglycan-binding domain-containing protein [Anaerolineae bacterium]|nr:LysM peptidoglycan-binding domain-containing protein [Anaerolineae bacterium]